MTANQPEERHVGSGLNGIYTGEKNKKEKREACTPGVLFKFLERNVLMMRTVKTRKNVLKDFGWMMDG